MLPAQVHFPGPQPVRSLMKGVPPQQALPRSLASLKRSMLLHGELLQRSLPLHGELLQQALPLHGELLQQALSLHGELLQWALPLHGELTCSLKRSLILLTLLGLSAQLQQISCVTLIRH